MKQVLRTIFAIIICVIGLVMVLISNSYKIESVVYWVLYIPCIILVYYPLASYWIDFLKRNL